MKRRRFLAEAIKSARKDRETQLLAAAVMRLIMRDAAEVLAEIGGETSGTVSDDDLARAVVGRLVRDAIVEDADAAAAEIHLRDVRESSRP